MPQTSFTTTRTFHYKTTRWKINVERLAFFSSHLIRRVFGEERAREATDITFLQVKTCALDNIT